MLNDLICRTVKGLYGHLNFWERLFVGLRLRLLPLADLDLMLPRDGKILEMGCGYGLMANYLSLSSSGRRIIGIDIDKKRILAAKEAAASNSNLDFRIADIASYACDIKFDAVVIIDSLHYFPTETQRSILARACRALKSGGLLVFRDIDADGTLKFRWNKLHERIMVGASFTQTNSCKSSLHFLPKEEYYEFLSELGFVDIYIRRDRSFLPYTNTVFHGVKP